MDIVFYTHANKSTGFGHASRSAKVARIIQTMNPKVKCGFYGEFDKTAREVISTITAVKFLENPVGKVGVYDRMDDPEDPYKWSNENFALLQRNCQSVVFMANSPKMPDLPEQVTIIGYKFGARHIGKKNCHWGIKFAPIEIDTVSARKASSEKGKILVALGGSEGSSATEKVITACNRIDEIKSIDVLSSPVNPITLQEVSAYTRKPLCVLSNVPSLGELICHAEIIFTSYGHLAYECMAMGKPICVAGQKNFQSLYASELTRRGLCISTGGISDLTVSELAHSIQNTILFKSKLIRENKRLFDGDGLKRTSKIILKILEEDNCN